MNNLLKTFLWSSVLLISLNCCSTKDSNYEISAMPYNFVRLDRYNGSDTTVIIPESFGGKKVLAINAGAFKDNTNLVSVVIPNSVRSIASDAFKGCSKLKSVTFPNQLRLIESNAFADCISLSSLILPDSVKQIENRAFKGCSTLKQVVIKSTNANIEVYAFDACVSLIYPTGNPTLDWYIIENEYRKYRMNEKPLLESLIDVFKKGYYPFHEFLCGTNDSITYSQARGKTISNHNEGVILGANIMRFRAEDIKPTYNGLPSNFITELASKPNGKILIVQYWSQSFEIDFYEIACLPKRYIPLNFSEIQYIIYVTHKPEKTVYYTNGGSITETKAFVDIYEKKPNNGFFKLLKNIGSRESAPAPIQTSTTGGAMNIDYTAMVDMVSEAVEHIKTLSEK